MFFPFDLNIESFMKEIKKRNASFKKIGKRYVSVRRGTDEKGLQRGKTANCFSLLMEHKSFMKKIKKQHVS